MVSFLKKVISKHPNFIFLGLAVFITSIRMWNYPAWFTFDADQETLSQMVKTVVVDHHPLLIGMPTSVGGMFIGPFLIYLLIPFYLIFQMQPIAQVVFVALNSIFLLFSLGFVASRVLSTKTATIAVLLYGFSWLLTIFDRTFWNPTLLPLIITWVVYFIWRYWENFPKRKYLFLSAITASAMFHLHFVSLAGYFFVFLSWGLIAILKKKLDPVGLLIIIGCAAVSLSPLFVFDFRHNFLISHNFANFLLHGGNASDTIIRQLPMLTRVRILLSILGTAVYNYPSVYLEALTALFIGLKAYKSYHSQGRESRTSKNFFEILFSILLLILFLIFLKSNTPILPYYFLIIFPLWAIVIARFVGDLMSMNVVVGVIVILLFLGVNVPEIVNTKNDLGLTNKEAVVDYIVDNADGKSFKVDFVSEPGRKTGFYYLFWLRGKTLIEDQTVKTQASYKIIITYRLVPEKELTTTIGPYGIIKK